MLFFFTGINIGSVKEYNSIFNVEIKVIEEYITLYGDSIIGTVYHPVAKQTDKTPLLTADHTRINLNTINNDRYIALSRNLIYQHDSIRKWDGKIPFGSKIYVESEDCTIDGFWIVHDTMNKRYKKNIDFMQNHLDINSFYGKWFNIKLKAKVKKELIYINNILIEEKIIDTNGLNIKYDV